MNTLQCCLIVTQNRHFFLSKNTLHKNIEAEIGWEIKNILRIYKAGLAGNVKNTEPRPKFPYSYKKKACTLGEWTIE